MSGGGCFLSAQRVYNLVCVVPTIKKSIREAMVFYFNFKLFFCLYQEEGILESSGLKVEATAQIDQEIQAGIV